jgi:hypothetical protein
MNGERSDLPDKKTDAGWYHVGIKELIRTRHTMLLQAALL